MLDADITFAVAIAALFVAGSVKGLVGMGLPTTALGILTLTIDPRTAIALILFPMLITNAWQMISSGHILRTVRRYWPFSSVLVLGVGATAYLTASAPDAFLLTALALVILLFVGLSWTDRIPELPDRFDSFSQVTAGAFGGVIGGLTAAWASPIGVYLTAKRVDKDEFVRASGFLIFLGSIPIFWAYAHLGLFSGPMATTSAIMIVPAMLGLSLGTMMRKRLNGDAFKNAVLVVFVLLALNLLRRAYWPL